VHDRKYSDKSTHSAVFNAPFTICRLTEEDTEYAIHAVKHVFPEHLVLQFDCTNTIAEQCLENVSVMLDLADAVIGMIYLFLLLICNNVAVGKGLCRHVCCVHARMHPQHFFCQLCSAC
jgi:hypothetical protein